MCDLRLTLGLGLVLVVVGSIGCGAVGENTDVLEQGLGGSIGVDPTPQPYGGSGGLMITFYNTNDQYNGVQDTTIRAATPNTVDGNSTSCTADGLAAERSCLMSFDVTIIPSNASVQRAELTFTILNKSTRTYELFELKQDWSESRATWKTRQLRTSWATPGAKGSADREATSFGYFTPSPLGTKTVAFDAAGVALVQRWVSQGPSANHGFVIARADVDDGVEIASSESPEVGDRPRLQVYYALP